MQCTNHLKQIGLGVHNFHDAQNGLVPTGFLARRSAFLYLLAPYAEQTAIWEMMTDPTKILNPDGTAAGGPNINAADGLGGICGLYAFPSDMRFGSAKTSYVDAGAWFNALPDDYKNSLSSIDWFFCPSRRSGASNRYCNDIVGGGTRCDYAFLVSIIDAVTTWDSGAADDTYEKDSNGPWQPGCMQENKHKPTHWCSPALYDGPFRTPEFRFTDVSDLASGEVINNEPARSPNREISATYTNWIAGWVPRDNFSWWADGASNQICVGEKHVPQWAVGVHGDLTAATSSTATAASRAATWDGGYWSNANSRSGYAMMLVRQYPPGSVTEELVSIARGPADVETSKEVIGDNYRDSLLGLGAYKGLGSAHNGAVNFLVGDGTVHSFPVDVSQLVLTMLTKVNDGNAVSLP
jgi:hypothetical protein